MKPAPYHKELYFQNTNYLIEFYTQYFNCAISAKVHEHFNNPRKTAFVLLCFEVFSYLVFNTHPSSSKEVYVQHFI